jgi:1-acyl-sn-glycerol-3-phosphate acyltransferase
MDAFERDFLKLRPTIMKWIRLALFGKKVHVSGLENLPMQGPVIIVGNHIGSYKDIATLIQISPRQIHFTANQEIFSRERFQALIRYHLQRHLKEFGLLLDVALRPIKTPFVNFISDSIGPVGSIPVDLTKGGTHAIRKCMEFLEAGKAVVLLQGMGRIDPKASHPYMTEFRRGPAVICHKLYRSRGLVVPVVPVAMYGTHLPWIVPGRIRVGIGRPLRITDGPVDDFDRSVARLREAMEKRMRVLLYRLVKGA